MKPLTDLTDFTLTCLKFGAILLSGVFGFLALFGENRNEKGRFTVWGKLALSGVMLSTLAAVGTQAVENKKHHEEELQATEKNRKLLTEIARGVYPLAPVKAITCEVFAKIPLTDPALKSYNDRLNGIFLRIADEQNDKKDIVDTYADSITDPTTGSVTVESFRFGPKSPAFPNPDTESVARFWLSQFRVWVIVTKTELTKTLRRSDAHLARPAEVPTLGLTFVLNLDHITYDYDPKARMLEVRATEMHLEKDVIQENDQIVSLPDLGGTEMLVQFDDDDAADDRSNGAVLRIEKVVKITSFGFTAAHHHFFIGSMSPVQGSEYPQYHYRLPAEIMNADVNLPASEETNGAIRSR